MKYCPKCEKTKDKKDFYKNSSKADGLQSYCKICQAANSRDWEKRNRKQYLKNNRIYNKLNSHKNIQRSAQYITNRRKTDPHFKFKHNLSCKIRKVIKGKKYKSTEKLLGCTVEEFRKYIERQFTDKMSWDNYGTYWHLDHIVPCSYYDLSKPHHQEECFFYTNYQPLEAKRNLRKSNRLDHDY